MEGCCAQTSCASLSRAAGAAGLTRTGLGATRQSKGLLRVRGRARLRTPAPPPRVAPKPAIRPGSGVERRFEAAADPLAGRLAGSAGQGRDSSGTGPPFGLPVRDFDGPERPQARLGWKCTSRPSPCRTRHPKGGVACLFHSWGFLLDLQVRVTGMARCAGCPQRRAERAGAGIQHRRWSGRWGRWPQGPFGSLVATVFPTS